LPQDQLAAAAAVVARISNAPPVWAESRSVTGPLPSMSGKASSGQPDDLGHL
jgi:hypothetical protein